MHTGCLAEFDRSQGQQERCFLHCHCNANDFIETMKTGALTLTANLRSRVGIPVASSSYRPMLIGALVFLLISRLAIIYAFDVAPTSDMEWYFGRAQEFLRTGRYAENGISTAYWPVGYPVFLASVMGVFGNKVLVGQLANLALSAGCLLVLHRFCMDRFGGSKVADVAVVLLAVYPNHMGYSVGLYSEPLYTLLLLVLVAYTKPDSSLQRFALMGFVVGVATLVKAQMLLLGPILLFMLALRNWSRPALFLAANRALIASLFMVVTILPWTWRNQVVMGAPVPVSTNGGMSLLAGNNPSMTSQLDRSFNDRDPLFQTVQFSVADQVAADQRAKAAAWEWIAENPGKFIVLMPKKVFRLWIPDGESEWSFQAGYAQYEDHKIGFRTVRVVNQLFYWVLLAGCAYGLIRYLNFKDPSTLVVPLIMVFFTALSMVFSGQSRYHAPLMPFVIAYAAYAFVHLARSKEAGP